MRELNALDTPTRWIREGILTPRQSWKEKHAQREMFPQVLRKRPCLRGVRKTWAFAGLGAGRERL